MFKHGPVDVLALASGEPKFEGTILAELEKLAQAGTIRVLDAMILFKDAQGECTSLDIEDLDEEDKASLGFIETGTRGLFDSQDAETLWEGMVPGSAIVALAIENAWAVTLLNAIVSSGTEVAMHYRVPAVVVEEAFETLQASEKTSE